MQQQPIARINLNASPHFLKKSSRKVVKYPWIRGTSVKALADIDGVSFQSLTYPYVENAFGDVTK